MVRVSDKEEREEVYMGMFGFGKKKEKQSMEKKDEVLKQDLSKKENPGMVFLIHLFMEDACELPEKDRMTDIMERHLGDVDCFCHDEKVAGFAVKKYSTEFKEGKVPPQLMIAKCVPTDNMRIDTITRSQMWDCPESAEILESCKYQVVATDMLAAGLPYKDRADMLMDYAEALVEMFPSCVAVMFGTSGKMFKREQILNHQIPREQRFIYFAVNVRFFNIQGTNDQLVDTLGMSTLFLPDLQYHFHDMDVNAVINHAYNVLLYIYKNDCPIKSGETIDGIVNDQMSREVQWKCQFENALIQPAREVLDVCMGEYAAGGRT